MEFPPYDRRMSMILLALIIGMCTGSIAGGVGAAVHVKRQRRECAERARAHGLSDDAARKICRHRTKPNPPPVADDYWEE